MSLVRKKVQEFEAINGTHSMPNAVVEETGDKVREALSARLLFCVPKRMMTIGIWPDSCDIYVGFGVLSISFAVS